MQTDRMLYLALKSILNDYRSGMESGDWCGEPDAETKKQIADAEEALQQYELEMGPLPDWASAHNISGEPVLYAQLYTKNGRQRGNGMIFHVAGYGSFGVITDMGNTSTLNHEELLSLYEIGDFILNEEGYLKRKRQNPDLDFEEPSPE